MPHSSFLQLVCSNFDDVLTASALGSLIEGGDGNDSVRGGAADDTIFGGLKLVQGGISSTPEQADTLFGGEGNDIIYASGSSDNAASLTGNDVGTVIYGDGGNDTVFVTNATVYGGTGNDTISTAAGFAYGEDGDDTILGLGAGFQLQGGAGADSLYLTSGQGFADGGENGDHYFIDGPMQATITDSGSVGTDYVYLNAIADISALQYVRDGNDLVISTVSDFSDGTAEAGLKVLDWYNSVDSMEWFVTADGGSISGSHFV